MLKSVLVSQQFFLFVLGANGVRCLSKSWFFNIFLSVLVEFG